MTTRDQAVFGPSRDGQTRPDLGAAHLRAADAYQDVPILKPPTWSNEVAAYFYLGGISSGAFLVGAVVDLLGSARLRPFARRAHQVSFLTALPCAPLLILDLGRPSRFHHMLRIFKPSSPMNLGAWTLVAHTAFSGLLALRPSLERISGLGDVLGLLPPRVVSLLGLSPALTLGGYSGVLIGTTATPVWSASPLLGALFMASAVSTGTAAVGLASTLAEHPTAEEERMVAHLGAASGAAELGLLAGFVATSGEDAAPLFAGERRFLLPLGAALTLVGIVLDLASLVARRSVRRNGVAALSTLLGGALLRWGVVRAGHASALDRAGYLRHTRPAASTPGWSAPQAR